MFDRKRYSKEYCRKNSEKLSERSRKYYRDNSEKLKKSHRKYWKKYYENNIKKLKEKVQIYYKKHPEKIIERRNRYKKYYQKNLVEIRKKYRKYGAKRRLNLTFRLSNAMSTLIWYSLKGNKNGHHWEILVNFTLADLKLHLEKLFKPGMSWNNYGKWHIDHVIPVSWWEFKSYNDKEFKQCWALCNLQPLWANENSSKGNRVVTI